MEELFNIPTCSICTLDCRHKDHNICSMSCIHVCEVHNMLSFHTYIHPCLKHILSDIFCHRHTDICFYQVCNNMDISCCRHIRNLWYQACSRVGIFCCRCTYIFLCPACIQQGSIYHRHTGISLYLACNHVDTFYRRYTDIF